ncbi:MAG: bifunctional glutamate N-acetyltransferase/amino-acid acetyltransferase ArgJ [Thermodesulfobacteriota bacterium]|jgi:glutamate N-acetyltransferase/amino-acid N-acetyltransferase
MTPARAEAVKNTKGVAARSKRLHLSGFLASAQSAEVKKGNTRSDLGLIFSEVPAVAAGVFTRNLVKAAPVQLNLERIVKQTGRAILVNSGNANACTGPGGLKDARRLSRQVSQALSIPDSQVFLASTGVIGKRLPMARMTKAVPALIQSLSPHGLPKVSEAIMTTDTFPKLISEEISIGKKKVHLVGMAKGAGMMHPDMATMLCFVLTDLAVSPALLDRFLRKAVAQSFSRITVDGDTSTNDTVLVMANGLAGNPVLVNLQTAGARLFSKALDQILLKLARMIVQDGEGATKEVTIRIEGTRTEEEARTLAMTVALSPLVKTALFGEDANWGRILAALGRSGIPFDPDKVDIYFNRIQLVKKGISKGPKEEIQAGLVLKKPSLTIRIDLHQGSAKTQVYTCDFSLDYVRINADYRT